MKPIKGLTLSLLLLALFLVYSNGVFAQSIDHLSERSTIIPLLEEGFWGAGQVDISDDGRYVVFQSNIKDEWKLFLHDLVKSETNEVPGLGEIPYFGHVSPSGKWLLFGKKSWVWKVPLEGGEMTLLRRANNWKAWESDASFLITQYSNGLWRVSADGSMDVRQIAAVDTTSGATNYHRPSMLPGGQGVLVSVGFNTGLDKRKVGVISLPGGKLTLLDEFGINPRYAGSGHILYTQGDHLKALPFDLEGLRVAGDPVTLLEGVNVYTNLASQFDISNNGTLVYVPGRSYLGRTWPSTLVWVDRDGLKTPFDSPAEKYFGIVRLSPDRRYVAAEVGFDLYLFDRQSGTWRVLAEEGRNESPVWSPNSDTLYYSHDDTPGRQPIDGSKAWEPIKAELTDFWGFSLAHDGTLMLGLYEPGPESSIWQLAGLSVQGDAEVEAILGDTKRDRRNPAISPDGRWLAYVEKVAGLDRIYVEPFPGGGNALLVSEGAAGEASEPIWGADASELFYRDALHMVSVRLTTAPALRLHSRQQLFPIKTYRKYLNTYAAVYDYDAATDRFLMPRWAIPNQPGDNLYIVKDAFELLNRLAPRW